MSIRRVGVSWLARRVDDRRSCHGSDRGFARTAQALLIPNTALMVAQNKAQLLGSKRVYSTKISQPWANVGCRWKIGQTNSGTKNFLNILSRMRARNSGNESHVGRFGDSARALSPPIPLHRPDKRDHGVTFCLPSSTGRGAGPLLNFNLGLQRRATIVFWIPRSELFHCELMERREPPELLGGDNSARWVRQPTPRRNAVRPLAEVAK